MNICCSKSVAVKCVPLLVTPILFAACSTHGRARGSDPTSDSQQSVASIRQLIPAAAGIPNDEWNRWEQSSTPTIESFRTKPITVGLLIDALPPEVDGTRDMITARKQEYSIDIGAHRQFAEEMKRSVPSGYHSIIQHDRISNVTCTLTDTGARGSVTFSVPGVCKGNVDYTAEKKQGQWQITEFRMPARSWIFRRDASGKWKWFDFFGEHGDADRIPCPQPLSGYITFNGEPLADAKIEFVHLRAPEAINRFPGNQRRTNEKGVFTTKLPKGKYGYRVTSRDLRLTYDFERERYTYRARDGSPLVTAVGEGENTLVVDLVSLDPQ